MKLCDVDDGTKNVYVPFKKYLGREVKKACQLAHAFEAKLIRGRNGDPQNDYTLSPSVHRYLKKSGHVTNRWLQWSKSGIFRSPPALPRGREIPSSECNYFVRGHHGKLPILYFRPNDGSKP